MPWVRLQDKTENATTARKKSQALQLTMFLL